jgi:Tfp pilus assembly protein PilF
MRNLFLIAVIPGLVMLMMSCASTTTPSAAVDKTKMSEGYLTRGYAYLEAEKFELALTEFHRSLVENPKNKWAHYYLGVTSDKLGKLADAEKHYSEAIDIDSSFSEAYNALGVVYSKQQKWKEAIKNFQRALENKLYSTRYIPYLNMGDAYMSQRDYDRAIDAYREAKRYEKIDFIIIKLGEALFEGGKVKDAVREFQEATAMYPANPLARYKLAVALLKNGNKSAAVAEFKKAAELAPGSEIARMANDYLKTLR